LHTADLPENTNHVTLYGSGLGDVQRKLLQSSLLKKLTLFF